MNVKVAKQCFINLDVKYMPIRSDVKVGGTMVTTVKVDPMLYGVGVGYQF